MVFRELLQELLRLPGAKYCCVADGAMGKVLASAGDEADDGPGVPLAVLGWGATAAGYLTSAASDELDDLIITSRRAYHLVRQLEGGSGQLLLVYLRLDRSRANLAVARRALGRVRAAPTPAPRQRDVAPEREIPVQSASLEVAANRRPSSAVALAAPPVLPRRHQVAALPQPRHPAAPRASPATAPAALSSPLPRRTAEAPPPAAPRTGPPAPSGARWADDVGTMRRLLSGLRRLR